MNIVHRPWDATTVRDVLIVTLGFVAVGMYLWVVITRIIMPGLDGIVLSTLIFG